MLVMSNHMEIFLRFECLDSVELAVASTLCFSVWFYCLNKCELFYCFIIVEKLVSKVRQFRFGCEVEFDNWNWKAILM